MYDPREGVRYPHIQANSLNRLYTQHQHLIQNGGGPFSHVETEKSKVEEEFRYHATSLFFILPAFQQVKMTARVSGYPGGYVERLAEPYNMDPGVYEPECDWQEDQQPAYPDTEQFLLDQFQATIIGEICNKKI